jgi:phosphoribosyl-AMP cyclohydrolase
VRLDCDADTVLLRVDSVAGVACHTGRRRCFFNRLEGEGAARRWVETDPVIADPEGSRHG